MTEPTVTLPATKTRMARCGHPVPSHPGMQKPACGDCAPPKKQRPTISKCEHCSEVFLVERKVGTVPRYCSARCRDKASMERRRLDGRYAEALRKRREKNQQSRRSIACARCGTTFTAERADRKYCSRKCGMAANRNTTSRQCEHEGCTKPVRAKGLCIQHYNKTYYPDRSKRWPEDPANKAKRDLIRTKRRRAVVKGVQAENVDRQVVGERDHWVCGICRHKVDKTLLYPHPMSQSLDHVVPLAEGGPHTYANTRIAHLQCNLVRQDRGGNEQLALLG